MLESQSYKDAREALTALFLARYRSESRLIAEKCVEEALSEFMGPACGDCLGAREMIVGDLRVVCESCGGSGLKAYSDFERARRMSMGLGRVRLLNGKIGWVSAELGFLDRLVNSIVAAELERGV
jgi:hypothetical protein